MVDLEDPHAVLNAIHTDMRRRFGADYRAATVETAIADLADAFGGNYPGLMRCDTHYHDLGHALDSGLAMARILCGQAAATQPASAEYIDPEHAVLGVVLALYHDIGLLRRSGEGHLQGAQLTPVHEARGVEFMGDYLKKTALAPLADKAALIMVTRLDWDIPADMPPLDRALASLLGSADLMCQVADRCYLEKCRDFLFLEFSAIGLAGPDGKLYPDPETLLAKTPGFYNNVVRRRIDNEYGGADQFMKLYFEAECPYQASIERNLGFLENMLAGDELSSLKRRPERIIDAKH